jgi:carotenoid phi-ring synthase / carotenoid chi-ring synthase
VSVTTIRHEDRFGVACDDGTGIEADGVVLATDVGGLRSIVHNSPDLGDDDWRRRIDGLQTAPPFVVQRLWLDRRVNSDRAAFMGTGGRPPLDNVSVLERYERQAADWSVQVGGSVVELHAYAVTAPDGGLCDHLVDRLHELYPETARANILGERVLRRNDCPRFAPGDFDRDPQSTHPAKA